MPSKAGLANDGPTVAKLSTPPESSKVCIQAGAQCFELCLADGVLPSFHERWASVSVVPAVKCRYCSKLLLIPSAKLVFGFHRQSLIYARLAACDGRHNSGLRCSRIGGQV
jgi:hypothetical protein